MGLNKDFRVKNSACVGDSLMVTNSAYIGGSTTIDDSLMVANSACIGGDTTIYGSLTVWGDETVLRTIISTTSALSVINHGTGPALYVKQAGLNEPIAQFVDHEGGQIIFADSGDVGIGTTTPSEKLTVAGNISANGSLSASGAGYNYFNGRVGIGTTAPEAALHVDAPGSTLSQWHRNGTQLVTIGASSNKGQIRFQYSGDCVSTGATTGGDYSIDTGGSVGAGDNMFYVCKAGNVGIGTTNPGEKLTVAGDVSARNGLSAASVTATTSPRGFVSAGRDLSDIFSPGGTAGGIGGSGTTCYIPAWEGSTCLGNSIACITPSQLTVAGSISSQGYCSALSANTIIGTNALYRNISGSCNTTIGYNAMYSAASGVQNTAIGACALHSDPGTYRNVAVGACALCDNTANYNTGIGTYAICANTTGRCNTGVGLWAMPANTTGDYNTGIGAASLNDNTTGSYNVGVGYVSLWGSITGIDNTAVGAIAIGQNANASYNTAVGRCAMYCGKAGCCNTSIGVCSLWGNCDGNNNIAVGACAGAKYRFLGVLDRDTSPTNSVFLGHKTCGMTGAETNTIVIGYSACSLGTDTVVLGNENITTTALRGNVGIGTTAPDYELDVAGDIGMNEYLYHNGDNDTYLRFGDNLTNLVAGGWSAIKLDKSTGKIQINNTNEDLDVQVMADDGEVILHTDAGTNKVGINTTSPGEALTVTGNISASGTIMGLNVPDIGTGTAGYITKWEDANTIGNSIAYELSNLLTVGGSISSTGALSASGAGYNYFNGRVGIGTDTPSHKLNVAVSDGDDGIVLQKAGSSNDLFKFSMDGTNDKAELFQYSLGNTIFAVRPTNVGYINTGQNFGIGTASPNEQLTVAGNISAGGNILTNSISAAGLSGNYFEGKVGIGTSRPNEKLTVKGNISACGSVTAANVCGVTSVCGATVCGTSYVCGAIVTDGSSCMDGSGNVCGCYFCAGNDVTASGGTVCGYYGCFTYLYCGGSQVYANNIPNSCLANSSVSYGGVSVALGASDATPAFCLCDSTAYKGDTSLVRGGAMFVDSISSYGGLSATATTRGFVSAGRDLADIFATSSGNVDGSGTANYLPVWSDTDTIGNSIACQSSTQLTVAGNISATGYLSAGLGINVPDSSKITAGSAQDLQIYHGSDDQSYISNVNGPGNLYIQNCTADKDIAFQADNGSGSATTYFKLDGSGVNTCVCQNFRFANNVKAGFGTAMDLTMCHDGSDAYIKNTAGALKIDQQTVNEDIRFFADNGYGSSAEYIRLDGSEETVLLSPGLPASAGNVGIGTLAPAEKLTVAGNISAGGSLSASGLSANYFRGRVGIGTAAPARKLNVVGDAEVSTNLVVGTALYTNDWTAGTSGIQYIKNSSGSTSIAIENGGNVGIGTAAPAAKLTVAGSISSQGYCSDVNSNTKIGTDALDANTTGDQNTALGHCALNDNTTGGCNVAIGHLSLKLNISGDGAVAIGYGAGCKHNIDRKNVYVGYEAGRFNTYGTGATFIGECAGFYNTTGSSNTFIGTQAMQGNTVGGSNVSIGVNSGLYSEGDGGDESVFIGSATGFCNDASYQVMIGGNAGRYHETGPNTTAVGYNANRGSDGNTTGYYNTSIGSCANYGITTAGRTVAVGYKANFSGTTANYSTAVGVCALHTTTIGGENVSVGYLSLYNNITGGCLVAIGNKALCSNNCTGFSTAVGHETLMTSITGANNTAVGFRALCKVNAIANTAVGTSALRNTTAGTYNEAFGVNALFNNTNGCQNVGIGTHALYSNTTGNNNTAVGNNALRSNTTGTFNTGVGLYAGCNNLTGDCNIMFGYAAGRYLANGSSSLCAPENSTYIGTCTRGNTDEENNAIVIGYCACSCGSNTISLGNANITNAYLNGSLSSNGTITSEAVHVSATTNGFVSAGRDLADIFATSSGNVDGSGTANYLPVWSDTDTIGNSIACQSSTQLTVAGNISANGSLTARSGYSYLGDRVAIGCNLNPGYGLSMPDDCAIGLGGSGDLRIQHTSSQSFIQNYTGPLYIDNNATDQDIIFRADDVNGTAVSYLSLDGGNEQVYISTGLPASAGEVGIGTTSPAEKLHVCSSTGNITTKIEVGGSGNANLQLKNNAGDRIIRATSDKLWFVDNTDGRTDMVIDGAGNVGIGISSPAEKLTVAGNISAQGGLSATGACSYFACSVGIKMQANDNALSLPDSEILALGSSADLQFSHSAPHSYITNTQNEGNLIIQNCGNNHDLILKTDDGYGGTAAYLQLDGGNQEVYISTGLPASAGNVGIGTTAPAEKLTVHGNISASGSLSASSGYSYLGDRVAIGCSIIPGYGLSMPDNCKIGLGNSGDLRFCHDGSHSYISADGTGSLYVQQHNADKDIAFQADNGSGSATTYFFLDGSAVDTRVCKNFRFANSVKAGFGTAMDFTMCHDGSDACIKNTAGALKIEQQTVNEDIRFFNDDGYGSPAEYIRLDGSEETVLLSPGLPASAGNVGIGTTAPAEKLTVSGSISTNAAATIGGFLYATCGRFSSNVCIGGNCILFPNDAASAYIRGADTLYLESDYDNDDTGGKPIIFQTAASEKMRVNGNGNVGIGTNVPAEKLTVHGNISASGSLSASGANNYFAGNVGIGTGTRVASDPDLKLEINSNTADNGIRITSGNTARHAIDLWTESGSNGGGDLRLYTGVNVIDSRFRGSGSFVHAACTGSNFGIGTCAPAEKLTVAGNISASGNGYFACVIAGGYFEEKAASPTLAGYSTGSLVVIGCGGNLELSTKSNDKNVFGVTQNGVCQPIVLGAEPVLVTGDIDVGDFITTSDTPGHGKKSIDSVHGSIIAQAMEAGCGCSYTLQAMIRKM